MGCHFQGDLENNGGLCLGCSFSLWIIPPSLTLGEAEHQAMRQSFGEAHMFFMAHVYESLEADSPQVAPWHDSSPPWLQLCERPWVSTTYSWTCHPQNLWDHKGVLFPTTNFWGHLLTQQQIANIPGYGIGLSIINLKKWDLITRFETGNNIKYVPFAILDIRKTVTVSIKE